MRANKNDGVYASCFQLGSAPDGWNLFVAERDELLDFISQNCISGVVLLSGVHRAGVIRASRTLFLQAMSTTRVCASCVAFYMRCARLNVITTVPIS
jgi:phosphodiesterase/alkaline phosphatase D-like protein